MRTFWLSFCDCDKPKGSQFLGACVVDVTVDRAEAIMPELDAKHPQHQPGAEWLAAALRKAWLHDCNPGGEVASTDITDAPAENLARYQRNRLYSRAEIEAIDIDIANDIKEAKA